MPDTLPFINSTKPRKSRIWARKSNAYCHLKGWMHRGDNNNDDYEDLLEFFLDKTLSEVPSLTEFGKYIYK